MRAEHRSEPAPHRHAATLGPLDLERQAVRALRNGDAQAAFRLIDRRCRTGPPAAPYCFVLRAEALDRMGLRDLAMADLIQALALAPDDALANRRMMLWADGEERLEAATTVVLRDRDPQVRSAAFRLLETAGRQHLAEIEVFDRSITGWVTWTGSDAPILDVGVDGEPSRVRLHPEPRHPLGGQGGFARFDVPRPRSEMVQTARVTWAGRQLAAVRMAPNMRVRPISRPAAPPVPQGDGVAVIVPVYADYEATRACLDSVMAAIGPDSPHRLVVVDDASPDRRLSAHLKMLSDAGRVMLLVNAQNLGFVGAVNIGLAAVPGCDVVLLNADTLVPVDFVDRLARAARAQPDIGTVTPLSNNGEFLSFPHPNRANPLPRAEDLRDLDAAAAHANAGALIDLPSGIGFCLYVTRACLDAVGPLSEDYHRGYLEDVDLCLRARAAGFRSVADPSIVVGHAGGRSFEASKRALVVRNLAVLERRFPDHRAECAAFMAADPLRAARAGIERHLGARPTRPVVFVVTAGPVAAVARERARQFAAAARPTMLIEVAATSGVIAGLSAPNGGVPQSLHFILDDEVEALRSYLEGLDAVGIELFDADRLPASLTAILTDLGPPIDLVLADGGLLAALGMPHPVSMRWPAPAVSLRAPRTTVDLPRFTRIVAPSPEAEALLESGVAARNRRSVRRPARATGLLAGHAPHLGLVPLFQTPSQRDLIDRLAEALLHRLPRLALTVLGTVPGQDRLAQRDRLFVTGSIDDADLDRMRLAHGASAVMILLDRPLFGHPTVAAAQRCGCPVAAIDWTCGRLPPAAGDLAIAPQASLDEAADCLAGWLHVTHARTETSLPLRRSA